MFSINKGVVTDGACMELHAEHDVTSGGAHTFVVALDENVSSQLQARVELYTDT